MERSLSFKGRVLAKKILPCKNSRKEMFIYRSRYKFIQNFSNKKKKFRDKKGRPFDLSDFCLESYIKRLYVKFNDSFSSSLILQSVILSPRS